MKALPLLNLGLLRIAPPRRATLTVELLDDMAKLFDKRVSVVDGIGMFGCDGSSLSSVICWSPQ